MNLETIIGLEIHVQLKTRSKMFCSCARVSELAAANSSCCAICLGHPGTLPAPNHQAIVLGLRAALALNGQVATRTKFDRKNYFYPDLPKGYQISQYDQPLSLGGSLTVDVPDNSIRSRPTITVRLTRLHLEEDAAKLLHDDQSGQSLVDFNRAGTPLAEIVTEPDVRSPEEARAFLEELRRIMRELDISDADMEKGHLRCDANISLRPVDTQGQPTESELHPKTEIKNLNSFRSVERALYFEIDRQTKLWELGTPPDINSTRGWNDTSGVTELQRTKEAANDYRYFPEPDIPEIDLTGLLDEAKHDRQELPAEKRARFIQEYSINTQGAYTLTEDKTLSDYFEHVISELIEWLLSEPDNKLTEEEIWPKLGPKLSKLVTGWLLSKLTGLMADRAIAWKTLKITPENFAEFLKLIYKEQLTSTNGLKVLEIMLESGADPSNIMEEKQLGRVTDVKVIHSAVLEVIHANSKQVEQFKAGKEVVVQFLVGMVMRQTEGRADPEATRKILIEELKK